MCFSCPKTSAPIGIGFQRVPDEKIDLSVFSHSQAEIFEPSFIFLLTWTKGTDLFALKVHIFCSSQKERIVEEGLEQIVIDAGIDQAHL